MELSWCVLVLILSTLSWSVVDPGLWHFTDMFWMWTGLSCYLPLRLNLLISAWSQLDFSWPSSGSQIWFRCWLEADWPPVTSDLWPAACWFSSSVDELIVVTLCALKWSVWFWFWFWRWFTFEFKNLKKSMNKICHKNYSSSCVYILSLAFLLQFSTKYLNMFNRHKMTPSLVLSSAVPQLSLPLINLTPPSPPTDISADWIPISLSQWRGQSFLFLRFILKLIFVF